MKKAFMTAVIKTIIVALLPFLILYHAQAQEGTQSTVVGTVTDSLGGLVVGARVSLVGAQGTVLSVAETDAQGRFLLNDTPVGSHAVLVSRKDFGSRRVAVQVTSGRVTELDVVLEISPLTEQVTVTAETNQTQNRDRVAQQVNVITDDTIRQRTTTVLAQVADEEVGVSLQRTSPTIGSVLVRGLTEVGVYVDGVRYTTSTQRGGINTFFNLNERLPCAPSNCYAGLTPRSTARTRSAAQYSLLSPSGRVKTLAFRRRL